MMEKNQKKIYSGCALCYHSCGTQVTVENNRLISVRGQESHPLNRGALCPKGMATIEHIYHPERLTHPLKRIGNVFKGISWDQALDEISFKLKDLKERFGPSVLGFFCGSIGVENIEMVGLTQRFKAAFGTPNYFSVESICYRMRIRSRQITFGKYPVEGLSSNLYVLWGHNPDESDFPLSLSIRENMEKGARLIVIDPKRIPLSDLGEMYVKIRPGTDGALALAMIHVIIKEDLYDADFVKRHTFGFERLVPHVEPYSPEWAEKVTWIPADHIRLLARTFATTRGAAIYQGTCTQDQQANGTQTNRAISILQTIVGGINVPGGWTISPRLHLKNISMPTSEAPLGCDKYPLFYNLWGRKSPYGIVNMVPENIPERLKSFIVVGGNPLVTMPDSNCFKEAFKKLELLVVYEQFLTETAKAAHYVLPATSHLEGWSLAYNYNVCHCLPYLMIREKAIEPVGECRGILDFGELFSWETERDLVADELEPCEMNFNYLNKEKPEGEFYQKVIYQIPPGTFKTPSGRIEIFSQALADVGYDPLPTYREPDKSPQGAFWETMGESFPLILSTGQRDLNYTNSQMHHLRSMQELSPYPKAEIGPGTAAAFGIKHKEEIYIETDRGRVRMRAWVDGRVAEGVVLVPHGWGGEANCNLLTDCMNREPIMGYPTWKSVLCNIRPVSFDIYSESGLTVSLSGLTRKSE